VTPMGYREILKAIRRECSQQGYSITPRYRVHADHRGSALYRPFLPMFNASSDPYASIRACFHRLYE
jgi:hypothetical protein